MWTTELSDKVDARVRNISSIRVKKADTGKEIAYLSVDYFPFYKFVQYRRYKKALQEHLDYLQADEVYIECPRHFFKSKRRRRRYA